MSRIGPIADNHMLTTELYRDAGDASDSRRMFAYGDQAQPERFGIHGVLMAVLVVLTLLLLVAVAR